MRAFLLPLLGPIIIVVISVAVSYGEPRYHTPSDLSVIVFAAVAVDWIISRRRGRTLAADDDDRELVLADDDALTSVS